MKEHTKTFYVDLHKEPFFMWHTKRDPIVVAAIQEGIRLGHTFPPAYVYCEEKAYYLIDGKHRTIAHYREQKPFLCEPAPMSPGNLEQMIRPQEVPFTKEAIFHDKIKDALTHLPRDIAERFCNEHGLDIEEYLEE